MVFDTLNLICVPLPLFHALLGIKPRYAPIPSGTPKRKQVANCNKKRYNDNDPIVVDESSNTMLTPPYAKPDSMYLSFPILFKQLSLQRIA